jgi:dTDP-4-amino-4,6-dideoxygalactose transaminase
MSQLAIEGGSRTVPEGIEKSWPIITQADKDAVMRVLDRGQIWGPDAPEKTALEQEWAAYVGTKHCLVTNSGTSALHACVAGIGVEPGDEVIIPAFTFWATAQAVVCQNAIPVFVDIDPITYNIDPKKIEEKITARTKAIIVVHVHGLPCDMDEINAIARKHGLKVLEDAAHAHGAYYKGRKPGNLGDMGMFSLNATKNLSGGEGGLVTTSNPEFYEGARLMCMFGEKQVPKGNIRPYDAFIMGNNYRPVEMTCAFTRSQLTRLEAYNAQRIANSELLTRELSQLPGVITPHVPADRNHVYHIYRVKLDPAAAGYPDIDREDFRWAVQHALFAEGVPAMEWHSFPVPGQKIFQNKNAYGKGCPWSCQFASQDIRYDANDYPETQKMFAASFVLYTIHAANGLELMQHYVKAFHKVYDQLDRVVTNPAYYQRVRASV